MTPRKPLAPTHSDLAKWRRLVKHARAAAVAPTGPAGDLRASAAAARRAVAPSWEALTACCSPLVRLGQAFAAMNNVQRREKAAELGQLAELVAAALGEAEGGPIVEAAPPAQRPLPFRADVDG